MCCNILDAFIDALVRFLWHMGCFKSNGDLKPFPPTRWDLIGRLKVTTGCHLNQQRRAENALNELCILYWDPVFCHMLTLGVVQDDAADYTQAFFDKSLRKRTFETADGKRGRLRALLCVAVKRFVIDERRKRRRFKRGGHLVRLPEDVSEIENRLSSAHGDPEVPDIAFDRLWASKMLDAVWQELEQSFAAKGEEKLFALLSLHVVGDEASAQTQVAAAESLGITAQAFWKRLKRLRLRFRKLLTDRIARTVASPDEIDDELNHLLKVFASPSLPA